MDDTNDSLRRLADLIRESKACISFTGAGISQESGIPTYRGEGGLWTKYDSSKYASIDYFNRDPSYYWNFFKEVRWPMLRDARPNQAHEALAEFEEQGKLQTVITQNIDGLHQAVGSKNVLELHGTSRVIICSDCRKRYPAAEIFARLDTQLPPFCENCDGLLRPDVVFFGEALDPDVLDEAFNEAGRCDVCIVVGSSLVVYPAAAIPQRAKQAGAKLAIFNYDPTPFDDMADFVFHTRAGPLLGQLVRSLKLRQPGF